MIRLTTRKKELLRLLSQSRRLPLLQVVSNNKSFSVGVQSPTEINAPRGCAVILRRICQLSLTRITHQVSRAFDLNSRVLCEQNCWKEYNRRHEQFSVSVAPLISKAEVSPPLRNASQNVQRFGFEICLLRRPESSHQDSH